MAIDEAVGKVWRRLKWVWPKLCFLALVLLVLVGLYAVRRIYDDRPVVYEDDEAHFKYGSTGGERGWKQQFGFGIPYWIWIALPELFHELLPDGEAGNGYASFGFIYEEGHDPRFDLPIGTSLRRVQGLDRVYVNCALCHTGSLREEPDGPRRIILGAPSNTLDLGAFTAFLDGAAKSRRFRPLEMMAQVRELAARRDRELGEARGINGGSYRPEPWGLIDSEIMNRVGVMAMRDQLLAFMGRLAFIDFATAGPGRVDTFNSPKALLGFDMAKADPDELFGNAEFPSIWNQKGRRGMHLHWDGNQCSTDERNLSAAFGTGATPATLDKRKIRRVADWLWDTARPPAFPAERIDRDLLPRGEELYGRYCWECHGNRETPFREPGDGGRVGTVEPIETIRTDRGRLDSYTPELAATQNSLYAGFPEAGEEHCRTYSESICDPDLSEEEFESIREQFLDECYPARFSHFRKTFGYANAPLDGIWLRAPYLHNGAVPSLRYLLEPAERRPEVFYTGYDLYDFEDVGFVTRPCCSAEETAGCVPAGSEELCVPAGRGWRFDTALRGNGRGGHEGPEYGTELPAGDKQALLEYLKTF